MHRARTDKVFVPVRMVVPKPETPNDLVPVILPLIVSVVEGAVVATAALAESASGAAMV